MSTPVKSPESKRMRAGDNPLEDHEMQPGSTANSELTLKAIEDLLDRKLDEKLGKLHEDLQSFKVAVRKELDEMGLKITRVQEESATTSKKIAEIEKQIGEYTGLYYLASQTAAVAGPSLAGLLVEWIGTHQVIFGFGAVFMALAFFAMQKVTELQTNNDAVEAS